MLIRSLLLGSFLGTVLSAQEPPADPVQPAPAPESKSDENWSADFDAAAKVAKRKGKDLLVDFTGSGWCGWCTRLHDEVFVHEEFLKAARERYVLVALDFQQTGESKEDQPNPTRNNELRDRWRIQGFPTILLVTPDGELFGRTGYQPGGAASYVEHLSGLHETGKQTLAEIAELAARLEAAKDDAKLEVLDAAIEKLGSLEDGSDFVEKVAAIVRSAFTIDPENQHGRKLKALHALRDAGAVNDDVVAAAKSLDPKNEQGELELTILARCNAARSQSELASLITLIEDLDAAGPIKDKEVGIQIYLNAALWNVRFLQQPDAAKKYAQKAKDLGVENPRALAFIEEILGS